MLEVSVYLEQNRPTQEQIQRIEDRIEKAVWFNESVQRLREVPEIGKVVALTIVSEIGDFKKVSFGPAICQLLSACTRQQGQWR